MVENIVSVKTRNAHTQSIETDIFQHIGIDILSQINVTNHIVATRASIVQVNAYLSSIETEVELLFGTTEAKAFQVYRIAQKNPSPSKIRSEFERRSGGERHRLLVLT